MNPEDHLPRLLGLARFIVTQHKVPPMEFDDAVQEGLIAAWTAMERHPDRAESYYNVALRNGILSYITGHTLTGRAARSRGSIGKDVRVESFESPEGAFGEIDPPYVDEYPSERETRVNESVDVLDRRDRAIVHGLFWLGMSYREVAPHVSLSESRTKKRWQYEIKPKLRQALAES